MRAGHFVAPDTIPHERESRCARACCWTPLGHSSAARACRCHEGAPMSSRTPRATLVAIQERDGVVRCVMTATEGDQNVPQHRQGGMGGRPEKHRPCNVLWINSILNGLIEANARLQEIAKAWGVKVPVWVDDVSRVPVYYRFENAWFLLDGVTRRRISAIDALDRMLEVYGDDYLAWKAAADEHAVMLLRGRF